MNFFTEFWTRYFDFKGRTSRKNFWLMYLVLFLIAFVLNLCKISALTGLWTLAIMIPSLAMHVRRLHDTNRSGWKLFWLYLSPMVAFLIILALATYLRAINLTDFISSYEATSLIIVEIIVVGLIVLAALISPIILLVFLCLPSVNENNKYGEPFNSSVKKVIGTCKVCGKQAILNEYGTCEECNAKIISNINQK